MLLSGKKDEWLYEPGDEGRPKHRWKHDYAGFVPARNGPVGKCPNHMTRSIAQKILNDEAVPVYEGDDSAYPDKFYAVYKGVVYEAVPTRPGISYHAYPWRGDLPGRKGLPRSVLRQLYQVAKRRDELKEFEKWLKKYGGPRCFSEALKGCDLS